MNLGSSVTFCTDIKPITKSLFSCAMVTAAVKKKNDVNYFRCVPDAAFLLMSTSTFSKFNAQFTTQFVAAKTKRNFYFESFTLPLLWWRRRLLHILDLLFAKGGKSIPVGCVPTAAVTTTRCQFQRRLYPDGGVSPSRQERSRPPRGQTDTCENITFPCGR